MPQSRIVVVISLLILVTACAGDDDSASDNGGAGGGGAGSSHAGAGGTGGSQAGSAGTGPGASGSAGSSSNAGAGGTASAGAASGGGGGQTSEQLKQATYTECEGNCSLVQMACPSSNFPACVSTCYEQADNAASTGQCADVLYGVLKCINTTQKTADITCTASGPDYAGCKTELTAYYDCVGM